jgi:hypothetical protein
LVAAVIVAAAAVPWSDGPLRRLAGGEGDGPEPRFDVAIDPHELRDLGRSLPRDATYAIDASSETPLVQGNLKAAGQLYLARQVPVHDPRQAGVVVGYRAGRVIEITPR